MSVRFGWSSGQSGKIRTWSRPSPAIWSRSSRARAGSKSYQEWNQPLRGV